MSEIRKVPGEIYSAITGNKVNLNMVGIDAMEGIGGIGTPPGNGGAEGIGNVITRFELYADEIAGRTISITLGGANTGIHWGTDEASTGTGLFTYTFPSDLSAFSETIDEDRQHYNQLLEPISSDPTVDVITVTISSEQILEFGELDGNNRDNLLTFRDIRTLIDPIPVIDGSMEPLVPVFSPDSPVTSNTIFRAPQGLVLARGDEFYFGGGKVFLGTVLERLPQLISKWSTARRFYGEINPNAPVPYTPPPSLTSLVFTSQRMSQPVMPNRCTVLNIEKQSLGVAPAVVENCCISGDVEGLFIDRLVESNVDIAPLMPNLDKVSVLNNFLLFSDMSDGGFDISSQKHMDYINSLFSNGNPWAFDMSELESVVDTAFGLRYTSSSLFNEGVETQINWNPASVMASVANMRPFMPSLSSASKLKKYVSIATQYAFIYDGHRSTHKPSGVEMDFLRELHIPTQLLCPQLPEGTNMDFVGGYGVRAVREPSPRKNGGKVVYTKQEWIDAGASPSLFDNLDDNEHAIYTKVPAYTKVVSGFNNGDYSHLYVGSDGTVDEDAGGARMTYIPTQPGLPEGVQYVLGYGRRLMYQSHGLMENVNTTIGESGVTSAGALGEIVQGTGQGRTVPDRHYIDRLPEDSIIIPALPESVRYVQDFLEEAFVLSPREELGQQIWKAYEYKPANVSGWVNGWLRANAVPVNPSTINIQMNSMQNLVEVVGWMERAYSGFWNFREIMDSLDDKRRFVPFPNASNNVRYKKMFTNAFSGINVDFRRWIPYKGFEALQDEIRIFEWLNNLSTHASFEWHHWNITSSNYNYDQEHFFFPEPSVLGPGEEINRGNAPSYLEGGHVAFPWWLNRPLVGERQSRFFSIEGLMEDIPSVADDPNSSERTLDNFESTFNGNFYGDVEAFRDKHKSSSVISGQHYVTHGSNMRYGLRLEDQYTGDDINWVVRDSENALIY